MEIKDHIVHVQFRNYKALKNFSVSLSSFNVLVGPNNSGKSTIIGAFRILSEGMRRAAAKRPEFIQAVDGWGYRVPLDAVPVSTENVFSDYDESRPARIEFSFSNGNRLDLIFPSVGVCYMMCVTKYKAVRTTTEFKKQYRATVGFVPILGPVEHEEPMFQREAARNALITQRASRNFRNIWHHFPEKFKEFRELLMSTWPGMDIQRPERYEGEKRTMLRMICREEHLSTEIFWSGFGFQVWCQMLTYIVQAKSDCLLVIDEPDIYLHSDLQRQLVDLLQTVGPDILIATHSTEIIAETDPGSLLVVRKRSKSAKKIADENKLQEIFSVLGSTLNPTLTRIARTRRVLFVEGKDFRILAGVARRLGKHAIANQSDYAVVPVGGFNPQRLVEFSKGIELALGSSILKAVVFDRDYRSETEVNSITAELSKHAQPVKVLLRKELENYLLVPSSLHRAIEFAIAEQNKRTGSTQSFVGSVDKILFDVCEPLKEKVCGQFLSKRGSAERALNPKYDPATINEQLLREFNDRWRNTDSRLAIVPGKEVLAGLNDVLQANYGVRLSATAIINSMKKDEVPVELVEIVREFETFRKTKAH